MLTKIRIATRQSALALWQANDVGARLVAAYPGLEIEIVGMTTEGDRNKVSPLSTIGGKGLFVKELEVALLGGSAEIAVHSMKDVPSELPDGLLIEAVCERADPRDAFVSNHFVSMASLPKGSKVGTSSLRRKLQLQDRYPDLVFLELRGNVDTRLRKLDEGLYDAIILATAGLRRLGFEARITAAIDTSECLPAAGQGAVGIECRADQDEVRTMLASINHEPTAIRVRSERLISRGLGANCNLPIGAFTEIHGDQIRVSGFVGDVTGGGHLRVERTGSITDADELAKQVTQELIDLGANRLIPAG